MTKYEFHISKAARLKYKFNESFYSVTGDLIVASPASARIISEKINNVRKSESDFANLVTPGEVNALGLIHEIYHYLIRRYEENENPDVFKRGLEYLRTKLNPADLNNVLLTFINEFPPLNVFHKKETPEEYLKGKTGTRDNKQIILEELILLHFENINPAAVRLNELFNDHPLIAKTKYKKLIGETEQFFEKEKPFGYGGLHLFSALRKPIDENPYNLEGQLNFIANEWRLLLTEKLLRKLLRGSDLIREDYKLFVKHGGGEKATPPVPDYKAEIDKLRLLKKSKDDKTKLTAEEQFTEDTDWMPDVVMIAKNVFVWLHQLTEKYGREIKRLDEIPDEELDKLAEWNFTALWLIGIWERSSASKKIKQFTGNPEAAASAYSLYDYEIARELGGEDAFQNLKRRAIQRGIRLASDMVPNHTGIFSKWIIEKPDYFIQTDRPPFPSYKFTGADLSDDNRVEIRIEDKYYTREDAAVVFERKDKITGETRYIYHGNDGTYMPWNDTAQLNLLNSETRESLIRLIEHVARKTPIIRFDAAMTLTQKHYQRLWFPEPGEGGAIPSRSDYSMTKQEFLKKMPDEFWREVVDRINKDLPNTLLLAEAFWLMEGYFVRTLGMHRVYNSAFMHMMMKEENSNYRKLIINTLQFNPEILKRYVNFMSNPDEETAVNQFGKGDKYFGVAIMMVTLPGLPMFGHGQIEGFAEKYGMEYKRAYYNEVVDEHLVWRHKREIFPLLTLRRLFSQVDNFEFYTFVTDEGKTIEDVFAFSNQYGDQSALVIYNNSYSTYSGVIQHSVSRVLTGNNNGKVQPVKSIAEILHIKNDEHYFYIYTDHRTQLQFLISGKEINKKGFASKLFGYQYRICLNFKEVYDDSGKYKKLIRHLHGRGVADIEEAILEMDMIPIHSVLGELLAPPNIRRIRNYIFPPEETSVKKPRRKVKLSDSLRSGIKSLVKEINKYDALVANKDLVEKKFEKYITHTQNFYKLWSRYHNRKTVSKWMIDANATIPLNIKNKSNDKICTFAAFTTLRSLISKRDSLFDKLLLRKPLNQIFNQHYPEDISSSQILLLKSLLHFDNELKRVKIKFKKKKSKDLKKKNGRQKRAALQKVSISDLLSNVTIRRFLQVNEYGGITYFNRERFEEMIKWFLLLIVIRSFSAYEKTVIGLKNKNGKGKLKKHLSKQKLEREYIASVKNNFLSAKNLIWLAEEAGYNINRFKNILVNVKSKDKMKTNYEINDDE